MPRFTARERRARYLREYEFQKRTGKPFFPYAVLHDTITSLFVVALIIGLTIAWHSGFGHASSDPNGGQNGGFLGPAYESRADPGTVSYDPRPEWYFFFLFQLLRIFSNPNLILFATIIIPTGLMVLLIAWPFIDRRPERRLSRRPIAAVIAVAVPVILLTLTWQGSQAPAVAGATSTHPGAAAFAAGACATCHTFKDAGTVGTLANLDSLHPTYQVALNAITNGKAGGMPSWSGSYSPIQIKCLSSYVATWAGAAGPTTPGPSAGTVPSGTYPAACKAAGGIFAGS